ncbi:MAG: sortase [Patescibacteria group bacterium]
MLDGFNNSEILAFYGIAAEDQSLSQTTILYRAVDTIDNLTLQQKLGIALCVVAVAALISSAWPIIQLESSFLIRTGFDNTNSGVRSWFNSLQGQKNDPNLQLQPKADRPLADTTPPAKVFDPLVDNDGNKIKPVNNDFALIVPKVGINTSVVPGVNPVNRTGYLDALKKGVAHSSTSFLPDQNGTVYLFSHSTNYEWFIDDLNAVFYYLKNIEAGELIVVMYRGNRYTYKIREKKIISPREINYLIPQPGVRTLILQTCWPPGTVSKRMLIFADLIDEKIYGKFDEVQI